MLPLQGRDAAGLLEKPPVPAAPSQQPVPCPTWPVQCPTWPLRHRLQLLMLLPCDHNHVVPLHGRDLLSRAGGRLQTSNTGRSKMHPGTRPGRALGGEEEMAPKGTGGHGSAGGSV